MLSNVMPLSIRVKSQSFIGGGGGREGGRKEGKEIKTLVGGTSRAFPNIEWNIKIHE